MKSLKSIVNSYSNSFDLLKRISALYFIPQNGGYKNSFYYLTREILSSNLSEEGPKIPIREFNSLCRELLQREHGWANDPFEQSFTESFSYFQHSYIVFPGYWNGSNYIIQHLAKAIVFSGNFDRSKFLLEANWAITTILNISEELAKRFNIPRNTKSERADEVYIPSNLNSLKEQVIFTETELIELLGDKNLLSEFENFVLNHKNYIAKKDPANDLLVGKPIVKFKDIYIVPDPNNLLPALRNRLLMLGKKHNLFDQLLQTYHLSIQGDINRSLKKMNKHQVEIKIPNCEKKQINEGIWGFDIDKALYQVTIEDHLKEYNFKENFGRWDNEELINYLFTQRIPNIQKYFYENITGINDLFIVVIISGLGRYNFTGIPNIENSLSKTVLTLNSWELHIISHLEAGDELALYNFSKATDKLRETTHVQRFTPLDEYSIYKSNGDTFYFSDDRKPDQLAIPPGEQRYIVDEYVQKFDRHLVSSYRDGYLSEVVRFDTESEIPIYFALENLEDQPSLVVESFKFPIWTLSFTDNVPHSIRADFVEMLAYWLWQISLELRDEINKLVEFIDKLVFEVNFQEPEIWEKEFEYSDNENENELVATYKFNLPKVEICITKAFRLKSFGQNNLAERELVSLLINLFERLLQMHSFKNTVKIIDSRKEKLIDEIAPSGPKKKLITFENIKYFSVDSRNLPSFSGIPEYNENEQLDNLGDYLIQEKKYKPRKLNRDESIEVLRETVGYFFNRLKNEIKSLSTEKSLKKLIAIYEKIIQKRELRKLTIPTQLACYSTEEELVDQISEEFNNLNKSGIACRFLIELISAEAPNGIRPLSRHLLNRLLAMSSELINWAFLSDMKKYEIQDIGIEILESHRLGAERTGLQKAQDKFFELRSQESIRKSKNYFSKYWQESTSNLNEDKPEFVKQLDIAYKEEFGIELSKLSVLYGEILNIGFQKDQPYKEMSNKRLLTNLSENTKIKLEVVKTGIDLISLKSREEFLNPRDPFRKEDVYPWRYGRPLSYILKPLIKIQKNGATKYLWGNRNVKASIDYLQNIILSGRIQGKVNSQLFKQLMTEIQQDRGSNFTNLVFEFTNSFNDTIVEKEVDKIGSTRIARDGNDLGDIDVLVIIPNKKNVLLIECKKLATARNPHEMRYELNSLFRDTNKKRSTAKKHLRRVKWIKENKSLFFNEYQLKSGGNWKFIPLLVVDEEMFTPHLYSPPFSVHSFHSFKIEIKAYL